MSRLRSLDSKISFFAFADIITAVSGVLIFVALLLATDLGRPTERQPQATVSEQEQLLQETLAREAEIDAQNRRLQEMLTAADAAPDIGKLQSDVASLRSQLAEAKKKQAAVAGQMSESEAQIAARDKTLGLTDLKSSVLRAREEADAVARQNAEARSEMEQLEQQVARLEAKLLKLHERDGQIWLIPDKSNTTKEPILVTISGAGVTIDRFDRPDQHRQFLATEATSSFKSFLSGAKTLDQYFVFLVRPSGITTFQELVKTARGLGFDVGYDALEEDRQIHFSTPPAITEPDSPAAPAAPATPASGGSPTNSVTPPVSHTAPPATQNITPAPATNAPAASKSWWQRFKEWLGIQ